MRWRRGHQVGLTPELVVKLVHDELVATLGSEAQPHIAPHDRPIGRSMVGLQGSQDDEPPPSSPSG